MATKVLPPAQARPDPMPPRTLLVRPFSSVPVSPYRSVVPSSVPMAISVGVARAALAAKMEARRNGRTFVPIMKVSIHKSRWKKFPRLASSLGRLDEAFMTVEAGRG